MNSKTPALAGYCPVAYFAAGRALRGSPDYQSSVGGKTYYLLSADAKAAFDADPARYLPAYDGQCAYGMSLNKSFAVDPSRFKIVNDRLLLFLHSDETDALALWNDADESAQLEAADANYSASRRGGRR